MKFFVHWKETHVYSYTTVVEADSAREAKEKCESHEYDDNRDAEFDRVKSVGRKRAETLDDHMNKARKNIKI